MRKQFVSPVKAGTKKGKWFWYPNDEDRKMRLLDTRGLGESETPAGANKDMTPLDELKETFDNKWKPKKYYCWEGKTCKEHNYNYLDPSKNKCGQNMIAQVPLFVYDNKEQCLKDNTQCKDLDKQNCLQKSNCGWCTNSFGRGICVDGTPMGPINYNLPCWPSTGKYYNNYTGGVPNQFEN